MSQNSITIPLDESTRLALLKRTTAFPMSPETVAATMFYQFAHHAPTELVSWLASQRGGYGGNIWNEFSLAERTKQRQDFAPELALAEAIRVVVTTKRGG